MVAMTKQKSWSVVARYLNLQPSSYERRNSTGKFNNNQHIRASPRSSVRVWLRRYIGYPLVEGETVRADRLRRFIGYLLVAFGWL